MVKNINAGKKTPYYQVIATYICRLVDFTEFLQKYRECEILKFLNCTVPQCGKTRNYLSPKNIKKV